MFQPAREMTSPPRVVAAILFAFAFPPLAVDLLAAAMALPKEPHRISIVVAALPGALMMSLLAGWIFVLPACVAWAVLHQLDRQYRSAAAFVGLATGLAFAALLKTFDDEDTQAVAMHLTGAAAGLLTGLGVWWIAYGRQERFRSIVTRPPLNL
ncbi:hypothetical protein [Caulobacter sp. Root1472]|jgi:hypothetical protein|uniref:hypothetical protein n=1 Tax=Caulobacter sp. Root1472 TaxID=1736470 RepID=UPI0006F6B13D|nr:hypothetical protein [Caulobacter sp. Root1472]KQZ32311.1 hypothetical protein ASD47_14615 [Caulobacter sp. Root1472]